jgi:acyl carrier protein
MSNILDDRFKKENEYWSQKLKENNQISRFPYDFNNDNPRTYIQLEYCGELPLMVSQKLVSISGGSDFALYMILLTGVRFVLEKYLETSDTIVIMPVFRQSGGTGALINNILPLRLDSSNLKSFKEFLIETKCIITEANAHQNYSVTKQLKLGHGEGGRPVLNTVALLDSVHDRAYLGDFETELMFNFSKAHNNSIELNLIYNARVYKKETVHKIFIHISKYFEIISNNPTVSLCDISIMSAEESDKIHSGLLLMNNSNKENALQKEYVEEKLLDLLKIQLGNNEIGLDDDFFSDLGGNSLIAIVFLTKVKAELNTEIPLANIFGKPTIRSMAEAICASTSESSQSDVSQLKQNEIISDTSFEMNSEMEENLEMEYYYLKNGEADEFVKKLDCTGKTLYFIFKKRCKNYYDYKSLFIMNFTFYAMLNDNNSLYNFDSFAYSLKEDIFKLNIYHSKGYCAMEQIEKLLDKGEQVIIVTHMVRVPFFDRFLGFDEPTGDEKRPNPLEDGTAEFSIHTFLAVAHKGEDLYYVEMPTIINRQNFVPYVGNKSVGIIKKRDLEAAFRVFVSFCTVDINLDNLKDRDYLKEALDMSMQSYKERQIYLCKYKILYEEEAIDFLISICDGNTIRLDTSENMRSESFYRFITWKIYEIAASRGVLAEVLREYKKTCNMEVKTELTEIFERAYEVWNDVVVLAHKKNQDKDYTVGKEYRDLFIEAKGLEYRIIELVPRLWD